MFTNCFRYILPAVATGLLATLAACSDEDLESPRQGGRQITFDVTDSRASSRAGVTAETPAGGSLSTVTLNAGAKQLYLIPEVTCGIIVDKHGDTPASRAAMTTADNIENFGVYASNGDDSGSYYMDNVEITKDNGWAPEKEYLWPGNGTLHINAYAPYLQSAGSEGVTALPSSDPSDSPEISYTVPSEVTSQNDLLWATPCDASASPCALTFNHALSAVRFITGAEMIPCVVKSITITSLKNVGTLNIETGIWSDVSGSADYTVLPDANLVAESGSEYVAETTPITDDAHSFMLLPQSLTEATSITVVLEYGDNEVEFTASLAGQTWIAGNTYTYRLSANPSVDRFVLTVDSPLAFNYTGGSQQYKVKSIHETILNGTVSTEDIPWTAEFVDDNGNAIDTPAWIVNMAMSGNGSCELTATTQMVEPTFINMNEHTRALREKSAVGSTDSPYNLSNSTGAPAVENTANTYIINAPGTYSLPLVYGNAIKNGADNTSAYVPTTSKAPFVNHLGNRITKPYIYDNAGCADANDAALVWEGQLNLVRNIRLSDDGKSIIFDVPAASIRQGNALIALRDRSGEIMWSWQIWVTDYVAGNGLQTFSHNGTPFEIMPLDLGRIFGGDDIDFPLSTASLRLTQHPADGSEGMTAIIKITQDGKHVHTPDCQSFYQWGRKDPMIAGVKEWYNADHTLIEGIDNVAITESGTLGNELVTEWIKAPARFWFYGTGGSPRFNTTNNWNSGTLARPAKTIFDPCPAGYRVPGNEFVALAQLPDASYSYSESNGDGHPAGFNVVSNANGETSFFAALGYLSGKSGSQITSSDGESIATFWTSRATATEASALVLLNGGTVSHSPVSDPRLEAFGVRPTRE